MTDKQLDELEDICTKGIAANVHVRYFTEMMDLITALRVERDALRRAYRDLSKCLLENGDLRTVDKANEILQDTLEAQQAELDAARRVCDEFNSAIEELDKSQSKGSNRQKEVYTLNVLLADAYQALLDYNDAYAGRRSESQAVVDKTEDF